MQKVETVADYIASYPSEKQVLLKQIRVALQKAVPEATETIKYGMPTLVLHGNLLHYAAMKNHIGFYPAPSGIETFAKALKPYHTSKGAVQFPLDQPLPLALITQIALFRKQENVENLKSKAKR